MKVPRSSSFFLQEYFVASDRWPTSHCQHSTMIRRLLVCLLLTLRETRGVTNLFRHDQDPLLRPFADAFSSRLAEIVEVKNPASVLVVNNSIIYVSSFLDDAVLFTNLPLTPTSKFRVFASGSYCTPYLKRCAILNGIVSTKVLLVHPIT